MRLAYIIIFSLITGVSGIAQTWLRQSTSLHIMKMNGKRGLAKNSFPNVIVPPLYDEVIWHNNKLLVVKIGNYCGIVDTLGVEKIKPDTYTDAYNIEDPINGKNFTFLSSKITNQNLLLDENGNNVTKNLYGIYKKQGDVLIVSVAFEDSIQRQLYFSPDEKNAYLKYGLLKSDGSWLLKPAKGELNFLNNHVIVATEDIQPYPTKKLSFFDLQGKPIINETLTNYCFDYFISDSLQKLKQFCVQNDTHEWIIDSMGTIVAKQKRHSPNLITVFDSISKKFGGQLNNEWVIPPEHDKIELTNDHAFGYNKALNTITIYSKSGNLLKTVQSFSSIGALNYLGFEKVRPLKDLLFGSNAQGFFLLNDQYETVSQPIKEIRQLLYTSRYSWLFSFKSDNNLFGVMNDKGKIILEPLSKLEPFKGADGLLFVPLDKRKYEVFDLNGKLINKAIDAVKTSNVNPDMYYFLKDSLECVFSLKNSKVLIPEGTYTRYSEIPFLHVILAYKKNEAFLLDRNFKLLSKKVLSKTALDYPYPIITTLKNKRRLIDTVESKLCKEYDAIYKTHIQNMFGKYLTKSSGKFGLINYRGKELLRCEWDTLFFFDKNAVVKSGNKFLITDTNFVIQKKIKPDTLKFYLRESACLYKTKNNWYSLLHPGAEVDCDEILEYTDAHLLRVQKGNKYGLYSLPQKKWLVKPVFDSAVFCSKRYKSPVPVFYTQINGKKYLIDTINNLALKPAFDFIEPMLLMTELYNPQLTNLLVNNGGKKSNSTTHHPQTNTLIGGKFGIVNSKSEWLHAMDGDQVISLIDKNYVVDYYVDFACDNVLGFLWNKGGSVEEYSNMRDSTEQEVYDKNGNMQIVRIAGEKWYDKKITGGKFGLVGASGEELLPVVYDKIIFMFYSHNREIFYRKNYSEETYSEPNDHLALYPVFIKKDNKWGVCDLSGRIIIPVEHDTILDEMLEEERIIKVFKNGKYGLFDLFGKTIIPAEFTGDLIPFQPPGEFGLNRFYILQNGGTNKNYYFVKKSEMEIFSENGESSFITVGDTAYFQYLSGGKLGVFIPGKSSSILPAEYDDIRFWRRVNDTSNNFINERISLTQKSRYRPTSLSSHQEPYLEIKKSGKWGIYSLTDGIIIQPQYEDIEVMASIIPYNPNFEFHGEYDHPEELTPALGFKFKQTGKWGVIDLNGKVIIKAEFDNITVTADQLYKATKANRSFLFNQNGQAAK